MAATANEATSRVLLNFDSQVERLAGWAAPDREAQAGRPVTLSLMAGSMLLGRLRRDRPRSDVDAHLGYSGPPVGFAVPDHGLAAFARICRLDEVTVSVGLGDDAPDRHALPALDGRSLASRPLASRHGIGDGARLADIWIEGSRNLNLRFEAPSNTAKAVAAFQAEPGGLLVKLASDQPIAGHTSIATFTLINPYAPVLLLFLGLDGLIDSIDLVPFPSLARGGGHAAERMIAAHGSDDLADTATLSESLLQAWLERIEHPDRAVTDIELDSSLGTGLEPILDEDLLGWLGDFLGIAVSRMGSVDTGQGPDFVDERLAAARPAAQGSGPRLLLPADAIPTISAAVRPLPEGAAPGLVAGGMGIVDPHRHGRVWSIWQPPTNYRFDDLQAAGGARFGPSLAVPGQGSRTTVGEAAVDWPLALVMRKAPTRILDNSPFETAPEIGWPLRAAEGSGISPVDVLILLDRKNSLPVPLLESLARQVQVDIRRLLICRPQSERNARVAGSAGRLFGDRFAAVPVPETAGRLEQIAAAANFLKEDLVVVLDAATLLPDHRTAGVLAAMLGDPDVASAGCLLRMADDKMRPFAAGYCLGEVKLTAAPALRFAAIDPSVWRGPCTYPVVANSLAIAAVRRNLLTRLVACGSSYLRPENDDLLLGLQALTAGGINLCTTVVSAYSSAGKANTGQLATAIPYRLSPQQLMMIAQSTTLVQRIA